MVSVLVLLLYLACCSSETVLATIQKQMAKLEEQMQRKLEEQMQRKLEEQMQRKDERMAKLEEQMQKKDDTIAVLSAALRAKQPDHKQLHLTAGGEVMDLVSFADFQATTSALATRIHACETKNADQDIEIVKMMSGASGSAPPTSVAPPRPAPSAHPTSPRGRRLQNSDGVNEISITGPNAVVSWNSRTPGLLPINCTGVGDGQLTCSGVLQAVDFITANGVSLASLSRLIPPPPPSSPPSAPPPPPDGFVSTGGTWSGGRLRGHGYSTGSIGQGETVQGVQFKTELRTDSFIGLTYSVPLSPRYRRYEEIEYAIYFHLGNDVYHATSATTGCCTLLAGQALTANTQVWQIRINSDSNVELVKDGTVIWTFGLPAWSSSGRLHIATDWGSPNAYDWQWTNASGATVGTAWA